MSEDSADPQLYVLSEGRGNEHKRCLSQGEKMAQLLDSKWAPYAYHYNNYIPFRTVSTFTVKTGVLK